jgi:hypothetical protein
MQPAQLFAQLFDFGFRQIFFVVRLDQLFGDIFQVAQNAFQHFADALDFGADILQRGTAARFRAVL